MEGGGVDVAWPGPTFSLVYATPLVNDERCCCVGAMCVLPARAQHKITLAYSCVAEQKHHDVS